MRSYIFTRAFFSSEIPGKYFSRILLIPKPGSFWNFTETVFLSSQMKNSDQKYPAKPVISDNCDQMVRKLLKNSGIHVPTALEISIARFRFPKFTFLRSLPWQSTLANGSSESHSQSENSFQNAGSLLIPRFCKNYSRSLSLPLFSQNHRSP